MGELGTHLAYRRASVGNSPPKVIRAAFLPDLAASTGGGSEGGGRACLTYALPLKTTVKKAYILRPEFRHETNDNAIVCLKGGDHDATYIDTRIRPCRRAHHRSRAIYTAPRATGQTGPGWVSLFDGKTISSEWDRVGETNWRVEDGAIVAQTHEPDRRASGHQD